MPNSKTPNSCGERFQNCKCRRCRQLLGRQHSDERRPYWHYPLTRLRQRATGNKRQHNNRPQQILQHKLKREPPCRGSLYFSISNSSDENIGASKNSTTVISKPRAIIMTVLSSIPLFLPLMILFIVPCCMLEDCSNRYWDIPRSFSNSFMRLATAWLTVKILSPYTINLVYQYKALKIRIYNAVFDCQ